MRRIPLILLVALAVLAGGLFCAPSAQAQEQDLAQLINDYRAECGLGELLYSDTVATAAARHSSDMAAFDYFAHVTGDSTYFMAGSRARQRMEDCGYPRGCWAGECIAGGYTDPAAILEAWKASPSHDAVLRNPEYKVVGIGVAYDAAAAYRWYWTADFGGCVDAGAWELPEPLPWPDIPAGDEELIAAGTWALDEGIFQGRTDGTFGPWDSLLRRHVALVAERMGLPCTLTTDDWAPALRSDVRDAIPGLEWLEERWDEPVTRSQVLRLMYRARDADPTAALLEQWFAETYVTWQGVTRQPRLIGHAALMVELSREHDVPLWLALGQCWRESQWGTTGLSITHNMLWGVKDAGGRWGELRGIVAGFADYATVEECIRAYFRLMDQGTYRGLIDAQDWRGLLDYYAPATENDTAEHYRIVMAVRAWAETRGIE